MRVDMSISHFLPSSEDRRSADLLRSLAESDLTSTMVIDVSGAEEDAQLLTAQHLRDRLLALPTTGTVRSGVDDRAKQAISEFFVAYPSSAFLPPGAFEPPDIEARVDDLKASLAGPLGSVMAKLAPRDPLGATSGLLRTLRDVQGKGLTSKEGILLSDDGAHAFLFWTPKGSAFDASLQRKNLEDLKSAFEGARTNPTMRVELSGVAPFTVHSEAQIHGDIQRIGTFSTIGILLLFGVMFRSWRMLLLGLVPLAFGSMVAMTVSHFLFGSVHGLTLAFGTSLLGVGIDYAEHYFAHYALEPGPGPNQVMRTVWPGLWMGALTTVAGLLALAWADFPGALQMAVFSSLAVAGALVGTRLLLPPWMPLDYARPPLPLKLERVAESLLGFLRRHRSWAFLPIAITLVVAIGLLKVTFIDDMSALLEIDPKITQEDERVRSRIAGSDPGRFAIVLGDSETAAVEQLDLAHEELLQSQKEGLVQSFMPLGALLRSPRVQAKNLEAARASLPLVMAALTSHGFRADLFQPYVDSITKDGNPITLAGLLASPLEAFVRPVSPKLGSQQAFVIPLGGVKSPAELRARVPHALIVDEGALLRESYHHVRTRVMGLVAIGLVFVAGLLLFRYRTLRLAMSALFPAVLAVICTVACLGWLSIRLNILHAIGLSLVLSMGVDYGIFIVEARASSHGAARSLVSILTATITTILSFGLLALSANPALRSLGLTISIGMTLSFVLCPSAVVLLTARAEKRTP